jgi:tetratricopeptide (TPR) repeat protein
MAYYRPLTNLSFYLERKEWGLRPMGYHLTNVIINAAVVFMMCLVLFRLFGKPEDSPRSAGSVWLAGLGGLLVGIHPAMNCVVTFISNRTYLLALFFLLVSCYALLRGQLKPQAASRKPDEGAWRLLFAGSFLLSALALEASLVFVAIAAGWLWMNRANYRNVKLWYLLTALPVASYFILRLGIARVPFASSVLRWAINDPLRVINTFGQQLQLLFFPFNHKVIYVIGAPFTGFSVYTILGLLFLGLPLYALVRRKKSPGSSPKLKQPSRPGPEAGGLSWLGYAWMVLFLLPFAHLVFLGPAGRILYLTVPGVLILLAALGRSLKVGESKGLKVGESGSQKNLRTFRPFDFSTPVRVAVSLYLAVFAVQTLRRNPIWRNELTLAQAMVQEAPESAGGHLNFGAALLSAGRKEEAIEQFRAAIEANPDYVGPHDQLAFALIDQEDLPGAITELREVVRLQPQSPDARNNLALALKRNGQLDSAIVEYKEAIRLDPNSELALNNLGSAWLARGDLRQAIVTLKAALRLKPGFAGARRNLADAYRAAGMPDSAAIVESSK